MITENNYYSQFKAFPQKELQWKTCGICSVAMVLDAENKFEKFKNKEKNLEIFLRHLVKKHKNGRPMYKKEIFLSGKKTSITVGKVNKKKDKSKLVLSKADKDFFPVFTLGNGFDHRSSKTIFEKFNLTANLIENISTEYINKALKNSTWKYFLASIHSLKGRGSHVVVVQNIGKDEQGRYFEIVDPAEITFEFGQKRLEMSFFKKNI